MKVRVIKAEGVLAYLRDGPVYLRNPPVNALRAEGQPDVPPFAHDGQGNVLDGEYKVGPHGEQVFDAGFAHHRHGIDSVAHHLGEFLRNRGSRVNPIDVINHAIEEFNDNHTDGDTHALDNFDSPQWRKTNANVLPGGDSAYNQETNAFTHTRPTRTNAGKKITNYTNKNYQTNQFGRFVESYAIPFHAELLRALVDMGFSRNELMQSNLNFLKYPYLPVERTVHSLDPDNEIGKVVRLHKPIGDSAVTDEARRQSPTNYFGDTTPVFTYNTLHHLPDIFFHPDLKESLGKKGKVHSWEHKGGLYAQAESIINQALERGVEHIPNVDVTINQGTMANPDMISRPLREILTTPDLKRSLIQDMSHVPAMMYLFGRSNQGNFKKLEDYMMQKYGSGEEGLSHEDHLGHFTAGEKGGKGMHSSARRIMALARKSGVGEAEDRSAFGEHSITPDELRAAGMYSNENLMGQVDRFRNVLEALADHQSNARDIQPKLALGDIPTSPLISPNVGNFPAINPETGQLETGLDPHMEEFLHHPHEYAPTSAYDPSMSAPQQNVLAGQLPPTVGSPTSGESLPQPPVRTPQPPMGAMPTSYPHTARQQFQQLRPQFAGLDPRQFRQVLDIAGSRRAGAPITDDPLSPVEMRAQQALADPAQTLLPFFNKSNPMGGAFDLLKRRDVI